MAKPRVFISSTFYDLRHIRSSLENFVESLGFDPVLSEKGAIAYNPDIPLDESCYKEAESCDIFVLIMGGRYGSPSSSDKKDLVKDFFYRYESITKLEYEAANKKDIPIYVLVEKAVYSEYDTFKNNRDNDTIKYAHVDSINVFYLIEKILNQPRNNPIQTFEKHQEIEVWLKEQWAGLFRDLLLKRSEKNQIASLAKQVGDLAEINTTLKRYLEEVVSKVSEEDAAKIIKDEDKRLKDSKQLKEFASLPVVNQLIEIDRLPLEKVREMYEKPKYFEEFADLLQQNTDSYKTDELLSAWHAAEPMFLENLNKPRLALGLDKLIFKNDMITKPKKSRNTNTQ